MLSVTVLGCGTAVPDPARGPAAFLVRYGGRTFLVDGGSGTLQRCMSAGVDPRTLDGGFYTHRHPDHCGDLVPLLFAMRVGPPRRTRDYPVVAGTGFQEFVDHMANAYGRSMVPGSGRLVVHELSTEAPDTWQADGLRLDSRPAAHSAGALHFRFSAEGRVVVFSGDTGPSDHLVALARGAHLLIVECAGSDAAPIPGHLTPSTVADIAAAARPAAVWLTHLYPGVDPDEALATVRATGIPTIHAHDGLCWP